MERQQTDRGVLVVETRRFFGAAVLIGVGGLVAFMGFVVGSLHALSEVLRLIARMETPPNELARAKMNQAVAAATAGAKAWRGHAHSDTESASG